MVTVVAVVFVTVVHWHISTDFKLVFTLNCYSHWNTQTGISVCVCVHNFEKLRRQFDFFYRRSYCIFIQIKIKWRCFQFNEHTHLLSKRVQLIAMWFYELRALCSFSNLDGQRLDAIYRIMQRKNKEKNKKKWKWKIQNGLG